MQHFVFVYGTLKEGFPNFSRNYGVRVPGAFQTQERYPFYLCGERFSPCLINDPGHGERVVGQVFTVDSPALAAMDVLERITEADGYRRVAVDLEAEHATGFGVLKAFAYLKPLQDVTACDVRVGPITEYTPEHAAHYRPR